MGGGSTILAMIDRLKDIKYIAETTLKGAAGLITALIRGPVVC